MHQRFLSRAILALASGLSLGLAACGGGSTASAPQSPQNITISGTVAHNVCGNGDASNDGNTPCFSTITSGNTVTIASGGQVWGQNSSSYSHVYGAYNDTDTNAVTGNQVLVNGIVSGDIYGGSHVLTSGDVTASGNSVTIGSGGVPGNVYGGYAQTGSGSATASNNTVLIDGPMATVLPSIIGGSASSNTGAITATGNTVTIQNIPLFTYVAVLWGESTNMISNPLPTDNNTLNLHAAGLSVVNMGGFQNLNFFLPANLAAVGTLPSAGQDCAGLSMGSAADQADSMLINGNSSNLGTDTVVHVSLDGAGPPLHRDDQFVLIRAGTKVDVPNWITGNLAPGSETGVIGGYNYTLAIVQNASQCGDLVLTIGAPAS